MSFFLIAPVSGNGGEFLEKIFKSFLPKYHAGDKRIRLCLMVREKHDVASFAYMLRDRRECLLRYLREINNILNTKP